LPWAAPSFEKSDAATGEWIAPTKPITNADIWDFLHLEHYVSHIKHRRRRGEPHLDPCPIPGETQHPATRWVVERTFSWLAKCRSSRTRWCTKAANWLALLQFACAHILFDLAFSG
jgi:hypothetical protein